MTRRLHHDIYAHSLKILSLSLMFLLCAPQNDQAYAEEATSGPIPTSKSSLIRGIDKDIKIKTQQKIENQHKLEQQDQDLKALRHKLVSISSKIKSAEQNLLKFDQVLDDLSDKQQELADQISRKKVEYSNLTLALVRLRRTPDIAILLNPEQPIQSAQTRSIIKNHMKALQSKTAELNDLSKNYAQNKASIYEKRTKADRLRTELEEDHQKLSHLLSQRQKDFARQKIILSEHTKQLNALARKADNLRDLLSSMQDNAELSNLKPSTKPIIQAGIMPDHGAYQLPMSGIVKIGYGQQDSFGALAKGLTIESYAGALAVAPFSGKVKYAGPFKNHENIVIIEHKDNYHTLIGGLEKIHVIVGQVVVSGEPLGILKGVDNNNKVETPKGQLYFELRHNGETINPALKFSDLG